MNKRSALSRPSQWIEELNGLTLKDVFESKRDVRKIGSTVYQIKRRVEPIESLYVDLGKERNKAVLQKEQITAATLAAALPPATAATAATAATPSEAAKIGAIIKLKKKKTVA